MLRLSPTTGLSLFKECPRCFWLHFNKNVHRPRGIFPSLPSGMDLVIKNYFDRYRSMGQAPVVEASLHCGVNKKERKLDKFLDLLWR